MIINKINLVPVNVTKPDKQLPALDCLHIGEDGHTVGGNGKSFLIVSPVVDNVKDTLKQIYDDNEIDTELSVSSETAKTIFKNIPRDTTYKGLLEHVDIDKKDNVAQFTLYDGSRKRKIDGKIPPLPYPPYKRLLKRLNDDKIMARCVINAKRFLPLLESLIQAANDSGDFSPIYMEFSKDNDIILRMENPVTKQRIIGLMWSYKGNEAQWLEFNEWENSMIDESKPVQKQPSPPVQITRPKAKKVGNRAQATMTKEMCPECGKYHLATDGLNKWCSCVSGCNYYEKGVR